MNTRMTVLDWALVGLIVLLTIFHATLLAGIFRGEDAAVALAGVDQSLLPDGNAPTGARTPTAADLAEANDDPSLPGTYVPPQGRRHTGAWPLDDDDRVPYCLSGDIRADCYASNPPSSGLHVPVQRSADLGDSVEAPLPPNPGVYEFDLPREAVPHLQEHAGVYVGYNCASDGCLDVVEALERVVLEELSQGARVVMSRFSDLQPGTIGMASWTRHDSFAASEFEAERVWRFIRAHSCRFDPEGFCRENPPES